MMVLDALWLPVMILYVLVLLFFLGFGSNLLYFTIVAATRGGPRPTPPKLRGHPVVTVQLPIYNEMYVVERLIQAACELDWPRRYLEIQVLDDSTDETQFMAARLVRQYAAQGFQITHLHRTDRIGFKAGALEAGLQAATGEYIAVFDADFVPPREFLRATIPHFADAKVGFVQARWGHLNRAYSVLTELQSVIIDAHFLVDQVARNRGGYFMNFNGTAGVWRRETVTDAGGWEHDTLAEDLDLSYRAQLRGWKAVYLPEVVAMAELPVTVAAYRAQQRRWAAGSFACAIKLLPRVLQSPLSRGVKLQAALHLCGYLSHVCLLVMFLLQPLLLYYSQRFPQSPSALGIAGVWLGITLLPSLAPGIYLTYAQWRAHGWNIYRLPYIFGASILGAGIMLTIVAALARVLYRRQVAFERTPKYGIARPSDTWGGKRYSLGAAPVLAIELVLAAFCFGTLGYAAAIGSWGSFFYTGYFLLGLLLVIGTSVYQLSGPVFSHALAAPVSGNRES